MSSTENLSNTVEQGLEQLTESEAALVTGSRAHQRFQETIEVLGKKALDIHTLLMGATDRLDATQAYTDSTTNQLATAYSSFTAAAKGTGNNELAGARDYTHKATQTFAGPNESVQAHLSHYGLKLHTISSLVGALMREITDIQNEAASTEDRMHDTAEAIGAARGHGISYLHVLHG